MNKKTSIIITVVILVAVVLLFFQLDRNDNGQKPIGNLITIEVPNYGEFEVPIEVNSVLGDEWRFEGGAYSADDKRLMFSITKFVNYDQVFTRLYLINMDGSNLQLLNEIEPSGRFWRPSLWQADDLIEIDHVSSDISHPFDMFLVDLEGDMITEPKFMYLFRVYDRPQHRYFLTPISSDSAPEVMLFPWAPNKALNQLIWSDVVDDMERVIQESNRNHYTAVGISNDGQVVIYYQFEIAEDEGGQVRPINPKLSIQNISDSDRIFVEAKDELTAVLNKNYPQKEFSVFNEFLFTIFDE